MTEPNPTLHQLDGHIVHPDLNGRPVMFLDFDGVLAPGNGNDPDREVVAAVENTLRLAGAGVVLCTDRVRFHDFDLGAFGLSRHYLRGQCDPDADATALPSTCDTFGTPTSSKVRRVIEWLDFADSVGVVPSAWCVLDDATTFAHDWRTCIVHVKPAGPVVSEAELWRVWSILTRKLPRRHTVIG